jgi:hypothetical protein
VLGHREMLQNHKAEPRPHGAFCLMLAHKNCKIPRGKAVE